DQHWGDYGFMGHPAIHTPRLDKLASESVVFTRGYVTAPLCCPSLASMVTGLHPHQHKITSNDPPMVAGKRGWSPERLKLRAEYITCIDRAPTLPRLLAKKGYLSHQSGKWWMGNHRRGGFTHGMTHGDPKRGGRHGDAGLAIGRKGMKPIFDFIDAAIAKPFFIWYAPFLPHTPHNPPERLLKKYRDKTPSLHIARYWAMCEWFDETCGQLLDHIDNKGLRDNTLVLYVCDNGWIQRPNSRSFAPRSKRSRFDGGVRTPIMVRWPGHATPRRDAVTPASSIDLAPTVLAAAGLPVPEEMQGANLLDADALAARPAVFGGAYAHDAVDIHDPASSLEWRWCVSGKWKLLIPHTQAKKGATVELFDILADPHEKQNVAAQHPDVVARLRARIDQWYGPKARGKGK
ncbi:sulfatase-like hydrolase/transferase, partial [bacterium]|nr:sulfatase-like hydrolase/transferase [bacterium]